MVIRKLEKRDVSAIAQIAKTAMPYPWNETIFRDCLGENYHAWVLELNGKIVGFVIILLHADECQLLNIAVSSGYQRQGYATYLLQHAIQFTKSQHVKRLLLEVRKSNVVAVQFYKKLGGQQIALRKNYYPSENGREDACVFVLDL